MKRMLALSVIVAAVLMLAAPWPAQTEPASQTYPDYFEIKGGYYYPTERIRLSEFSATDFDRRKGVDGEIAFGHYYAPFFGMEFGVGYIENRRFAGTGPGRTTLEALPVLLSAKLFLPLGPVEPYGEVGVGAYFTRFKEEGGPSGRRYFRSVDAGPHAGLGLNVNFTDTFYLGLEGRYRTQGQARIRGRYGQARRLYGNSQARIPILINKHLNSERRT